MATILLIDENDEVRLSISELLSFLRHDIIIAGNSRDAIELASLKHPDLIISETSISGIDGFGILQILRRSPVTWTIPFIFLSSQSDINFYRRAMSIGANDYLVKPFEGGELLRAVEGALALSLDRAVQSLSTCNAREAVNPLRKSPDVLDELISHSETFELKKGQVLYKEGDTPRFLYYLEKGKVKTYKRHENGKDLVVGLWAEKDFLGCAPLLEKVFYEETSQAIEEALVVLIPRIKLEELMCSRPEVMKRIIKMLAFNLMERERQLLDAAYNTVRKKVATALVKVGEKFKQNCGELCVQMRREELANLAGTATESLVRTLTEFKNEKLIKIDCGKIVITNHQKLSRLQS